MCGIFGYYGNRLSRDLLKCASRELSYRGRDAEDIFENQGLFLSHARLSIIDLATGGQPMRDPDTGNVIVFNGEAYNYLELKKKLLQDGVEFLTDSDTEVVLKGFGHLGLKMFENIEGMYAAGIWEEKSSRLYLFRDPLGKKPLYYWALPGGALSFSSTVSCFKHFPQWKDQLDPLGIALFLSRGDIPAPCSVWKEIKKVRPGHVLIYDSKCGIIEEKRLSGLQFCPLSGRISSTKKAETGFMAQLVNATRIRTRSDVPVGLTFSGGVDSGLLAFVLKDLGYDIPLFNIDYETKDNKSPERANAREVANLLGGDLIEIDFKPYSMFSDFPEAYRYFDEPNSQFPMVYYLQIMKEIKKMGISVVLTGNGADELFFGYNGNHLLRTYSALIRMASMGLPDIFWKNELRTLRKGDWAGFVVERERQELKRLSGVLRNFDGAGLLQRGDYFGSLKNDVDNANLKSVLDYAAWSNLTKNGVASNYLLPDINGLQSQVEVRAPFLDFQLIRLVMRLEPRFKIGSFFNGRYNKSLLKKLYARRVGKKIAYDAKRGMAWNIAWHKWISNEKPARDLIVQLLKRLDQWGICSSFFLEHFNTFCRSTQQGSGAGDMVMKGFLLSSWLVKECDGLNILEELMSPLNDFHPTSNYGG